VLPRRDDPLEQLPLVLSSFGVVVGGGEVDPGELRVHFVRPEPPLPLGHDLLPADGYPLPQRRDFVTSLRPACRFERVSQSP
jgi:hypothetical protein